MTTREYIENIKNRYKLGNATEHTFRGDLQQLIESIVPTIRATNEPKRQACGAPDYILTEKDIPVGFIEAKDIGDKDLEGKKANKEQFNRYKATKDQYFFTDYLTFYLYREGEFVTKIAIGEISDKGITPLPENFANFENLLKDFCTHVGQTIKNPKKLAEMMAGKAKLLSDIIEKALLSDETNHEDSTLKDQLKAFKEILIHDITPKGFADVYAQTIVYGMFAARLHDPTLPTFSRQEAAELIPKSNPFLRKLFGYIAGPDIDDRIKWIVDSLVDIFLHCNVDEILKNYGKTTKMEDPIIHFYETFLSEYDRKLRKTRGVWYTPQPVVNFIVRAVDDILKAEFDLPQGLADHSKIRVKVNQQGKQVEQEVHKVQILDPATGTGTFLTETIKHIHKGFEGQQGIWSNYVETHLLPRLNGFELLMASYAMAHLKLDLLLTETGYKATTNQRFRVYLTNSLEESHPDTGTLFANWLSTEANEANHIKRDTPVMCVIGNPPYSGESANKGEWISSLMEDYKKEPGGKEKLKEKNSKAINADEYKFIRYGQHFIEKNGSGVLAFINPHTFLDTPICRGMRWNLLNTFDKIYTIDLHGNSTKKETSPDGSVDTNVFDIMQGVSINIFVKTGKKKNNELGKVFHFNLFGKREFKYDFLIENNIKSVEYKEIPVIAPNYYFIPKNFDEEKDYSKGFELVNLMPFKTSGIKTHDDINLVSDNKVQLEKNLIELHQQFDNYKVYKYSYRPFDNGFIYYDTKLLGRAREKTMYHLKNENIGLILVAQPQAANLNYFDCVYITNCFTDTNMFRRGGPSTFPLYLFPATNGQQTVGQTEERTPNLNTEIVKQLAKKLGLTFTNEKVTTNDTFAPIDILDYIYAVLHSPTYREKYKEFLKIDFPRVPYPKDAKTFWSMVGLGGELRQIHLLESPKVENRITQYPIDDENKGFVRNVKYQDGKVYINETQYFDNVPQVAWDFYIGGYQPAQKWLKDRKERPLDFEDIQHFQKIIVALVETHRIMTEIDKIEIE
jgi:type I restriction-modification system DNA methylase subunit